MKQEIKTLLENNLKIDQIRKNIEIISYYKYLNNKDIIVINKKKDILNIDKKNNEFYRYNLYYIKLFNIKKIVSDIIFICYVYDGITEYNDIYRKAISYNTYSKKKIPFFVFGRNKIMKKSNLFTLIQDDITWGNGSGRLIKNKSYPSGIIINGIDSMVNEQKIKLKISYEKKYVYYACSKFGHLKSVHSRSIKSKIKYSPRFLLSIIKKKDIKIMFGQINNIIYKTKIYCKYQIVADGVGVTYPGFISKIINSSFIKKITDNDVRKNKNVIWEQWFYKNVEKNTNYFPIYIKNIYKIRYFKKKYYINKNTLLYKDLNSLKMDEYLLFNIKKWKNYIKNIKNEIIYNASIEKKNIKDIEDNIINKDEYILNIFNEYLAIDNCIELIQDTISDVECI